MMIQNNENRLLKKPKKEKMAKIILRQEAIDDLNNIWEYTFEKWSESQADKYYSMLKLSCKEIGKNPEIGKEYDEINKNLFG